MAKEITGSLKVLAESRTDMFHIDPRKINIKPTWNNRDFNDPTNIEHVDMLKSSIKEVGVKEPLTVYMEAGKVYVSDGECRLRAVMAAIKEGSDIKTVPVKNEDRHSNEADRVFSQILRNSGKPFSALEQAKTFKRLLDFGWLAKDIATKSGISASRVSQVLDLLTLPEPVKKMVIEGQVSASMAVQAVNNHNPSQAVKVLQDAVMEAKAQGRTRAMPKDTAEVKGNIRTVMQDAFEFSDIDNNHDDFVIIKMPTPKWETVKDLLKL